MAKDLAGWAQGEADRADDTLRHQSHDGPARRQSPRGTPSRSKRFQRYLPTILAMIGLVLIVITTIQQIYLQTRPVQTQVLDYPPQTVLSRVAGTNAPAIEADDDLLTRGEKCNSSGGSVIVKLEKSWVSLDPGGTFVPDGGGQSERVVGCETREYVNPVPPEVVNRTRELCRELGRNYITWQLTGLETPVDSEIQSEVWRSEPFRLYC